MNSTQTTTKINIDLRNEYNLDNRYAPDTKIVIIEFDSYMRLLDLLTPEQRAQNLHNAQNDLFHAVSGYVIEKL